MFLRFIKFGKSGNNHNYLYDPQLKPHHFCSPFSHERVEYKLVKCSIFKSISNGVYNDIY